MWKCTSFIIIIIIIIVIVVVVVIVIVIVIIIPHEDKVNVIAPVNILFRGGGEF